MFVLEWYVYVLVMLCVAVPMGLFYGLETWRVARAQRKDEADHGPYPCLVHLGTTPYGHEEWCWKQHGHVGPHDEPYRGDEELRLPEESHLDAEPLCSSISTDGYCNLGYGHSIPHNYV